MSHTQPIRVRIAPSPTGDWHLGNARTALFSYLFAKQNQGQFFLRVEDTDQARLVEGAVERLLDVLDWLGLPPDPYGGQVYVRQSEHLPKYREVAESLVESGHAYYCFAKPEELEAMRKEQEAAKQPPRYDNRWGYRELALEEAKSRVAAGESYVIRQKMPQTGPINFHDVVHGDIEVDASLIDDHILLKSDGFPTYHLAHVVDDHGMEISHVIRGDEWLASTPRHVVLHQALGWPQPIYVHVPIILGPDKGKLSKRHGAQPVIEYRDEGYLPEAVLNFLVLLGWSSGTEEEFFTREEMIERFNLERIQPSPAIFDKVRLDWFNAHYIRHLPTEALRDRLLAYWYKYEKKWQTYYELDPAKFDAIVAEVQDRMVTLKEFPTLAEVFYSVPNVDINLLLKGRSSETVKSDLEYVISILNDLAISSWNKRPIEDTLRHFLREKTDKPGEVFWSIRVALTGLTASPGAFEMLAVLGQEESLKRLKVALELVKTYETGT